MLGISGFLLPDGGVCLTGEVIEERMAADEAYKAGAWPWNGPFMQGDARGAVAWPDRGVTGGTASSNGCVAIGLMDPDGFMRVVLAHKFLMVSTSISADGHVKEGLGLILRDITSWGVHDVWVQADDVTDAATWFELILKDPATKGIRRPSNYANDMPQALTILREMGDKIITPAAYHAEIEQGNARGDVLPITKAIAMLAMSYKFHPSRRRGIGGHRFDIWV